LLLDSSWRRALKLSLHPVLASLEKRSLSGFVTAYPRVSKLYPMPSGGLASVEALYVARLLQGREDPSLLDGYYWKAKFMEMNRFLIKAIRAANLSGENTENL
jgi:pre-rRNA-processing protein TSR3